MASRLSCALFDNPVTQFHSEIPCVSFFRCKLYVSPTVVFYLSQTFTFSHASGILSPIYKQTVSLRFLSPLSDAIFLDFFDWTIVLSPSHVVCSPVYVSHCLLLYARAPANICSHCLRMLCRQILTIIPRMPLGIIITVNLTLPLLHLWILLNLITVLHAGQEME